ncbi:MAG: hypothetical protein K2X44_06170, partial [Magnetospirillum sp.]|nr:hypothetical protein [Magnetospirillum sp.]
VKTNPKETGEAPPWRIDQLGQNAIQKYGKLAEEEAKLQGVDPDLVKAIMYYENADGHKFGLNDVADKLGISGSVMPMNINPKIWGGLGIDRSDASDPQKNIRTAVTLIKRIQDRVDGPTPEKIGSLWNGIMLDQVNPRGARIGRIARERPWEK